MKKKLIQILMLLVAAVSMGAFVSCKDTNEDLYNQLRDETGKAIDRSQTMEQYLQQQIDLLKGQIAAYETALDNIKQCSCSDPGGLKDIVTGLTTQITNMQTVIDALTSGSGQGGDGSTGIPIIDQITDDIDDINDIINNVDGQGNSLQIFITNTETAQLLLQQAIDELKQQLAAIQACDCDGKFADVWNAIHILQTDVANTLAKANSAFDLATSANTTATAANATANNALNTANDAKLTAQQAKAAADGATTIANAATAAAENAVTLATNAQNIATQAGLDADAAKTLAQTAINNAQTALNTANAANALATELQTRVTALEAAVSTNTQNIQTNTQAIQDLQGNVTTIQNNITTIQNTINDYNTRITNNTNAINDNTAAIQQNAADIATNLSNIQANAAAIAANTTAIQQNAADIATIQSQLSTLSSNVQQALTDAAAANAQATTNAAAIANLKTDVENNQTAIQNLQTATQNLQTSVTNLTTQITNISGQVDTNTTNITNLTNSVNNLTSTVSTIQGSVNQLTSDVSELTTKLTNMEAELAAAKAECAANLILAKQYADAQIAAAQAAIEAEIQGLIAQLANFYTKDQVYTKEEVDALLAALQNAVNVSITNLTNQVNTNTTNITNNTNRLDGIDSQITGIGVRIDGLEGTVTTLTGQVVNLQSAVDDHGTRITALETKLGDYATLVQTVDGHTTLIESLQTDLTNLTNTVTGLSTTVDGHTSDIAAINAALAAIKQCTCDPSKISDIEDQLASILTRLTTAEGDIANNTTLINNVKNELTTLINDQIDQLKSELTDAINAVDGKADQNAADIAALQLAFNNLDYITPDEVDSKLSDLADAILAKVKADSLVSALKDEELKQRMDVIGDSVATAFADIVAMQATLAGLDAVYLKIEDFEAYKTQNEADKAEMIGRISANETAIGDLQTAVQNITDSIATLREDITDLQTRMKAAEDDLAYALDEIEDVKSDVAAIQDYLAKQVTGIIIQGTKNPWYGTFDTPFGIQSNVLIAFYGLPKSDIEFPTSRTGNYVRAKEALTDKDMEMLEGLDQFERLANVPLMHENGYAGKIYMTINPNTADVSGLQPVIVNTQDEESLITLTPIQKSTEKLQFGFTRADNGFYEADAVVTPANVQKVNGPKFETGALADAAQNARDAIEQIAKTQSLSGTGTKLESIATDINKIVNGLRFDKSGLKCSYTTDDGQTHSVYSDYNLAATAFKPLSLETAKDFHYVTIPGYEQANSLLDRISNTVHDKVHVFFHDLNNSALIEKIVNLQINDIKVPEISEDLLAKFELHMDTVFIMGGLEYHFQMPYDVNVPVKFEKDLTIPVDIEGIEVNVPVHIDDSVSVDLSDVSITSPTVVVTGNATGTGHTGEVIGTDGDGNPIYQTILIVPVLDANDNFVGYVNIPLDDITVDAAINASGGLAAGSTLSLMGEPVAHVVIDDTVSTTVDIHQNVTYHLVIEDTFTAHIDISKYIQLGYVGYQMDPNEPDGYAKDEDGNLIPLKDENGDPIPGDKRGFVLRFNYDMRDAAQELWGMAADALTDVNKMMADIRDIIDEVNNLVDKINGYEKTITDTVDNFLDRIRGYIDKINNVAIKAINNTNQLFQPFMVASTEKGTKRLSGSKNYPTVLTSNVKLFATTQTMELFVPLARKHVAVTNVFKGNASAQGGNSDCISKLRAANTGKLNTVLDGNERILNMKNLEPGYEYEIAYSALDFHGKIATRKYYITIQ